MIDKMSYTYGGNTINDPKFIQQVKIAGGSSTIGTVAVSNLFALDTTVVSSNTKLDTINSTANTINTTIGTSNTKLDTINSTANTINTTIGTSNTKLDTINTSIGTVNTSLNNLKIQQGAVSSGEKGLFIQGNSTSSAPTYSNDTINPLSLTTSGALRVDNSANTQPISGTIAISNSFALNSTLITSNDKLDTINTSINSINVNQGSSIVGQKGSLIQGATTSAAPSYLNSTLNPLSLTTSGALRVDNSANTQPISGTIAISNSFALDSTLTSTNSKIDTINTNLGTINTSINTNIISQSSITSGQKGSLIQGAVTTSAPTYTNGNTNPLSLTTTGALRVDVGGSSITADGVAQDSDTTGQLGPIIQGAVTTSAPTYTTGKTNPLSLTTTGALRVDIGGSSITADGVAQDSDTTGQLGPIIQGAVTTGAPLYTTGKTNPLSLTTTGALRVDIGAGTVAISGLAQNSDTSGQTGQLIQGAVTTSAPTYTSGKTNPLSLTTAGALRVDIGTSSITVDGLAQNADTSGQTGQLIQGAVTTNAPTYTTGKTNPLSLTTTGGLRVDVGNQPIAVKSIDQNSDTSGQSGFLIQGAVTSNTASYTNGKTNPLSLNVFGELRSTNDVISSTGNTTTTNISGSTTLNGSLTIIETSIPLTSVTEFQSSGTVLIDSEYITYSGITLNNLTGCVRGAFNSTVASHSNGAAVKGVFVGSSELNGKSDVMTSLITNVAGTKYYDFSNDGTTWITYPDTGFTVTENVHEFHIAVKGGRYFRVRFINSSSSKSTTFKLYTYYGIFSQGKLPLNQSITDDADSIITRSITTGKDPNGSYINSQLGGIDNNNSIIESVSQVLNGTISSSDILINLVSSTGLSDGDIIRIDSELIIIGTVGGNSLFDCTRGAYGTTASSHLSGQKVYKKYLIAGSTTVNIGGGILIGDTTITVTSTTDYPTSGTIIINNEYISYTGKSSTTFTGCTRGVYDSIITTHTNGSTVKNVYMGVWSDISNYIGLYITINGFAATTATGTLNMEFSHNGYTIIKKISIDVSDISSTAPRTLGSVAKYFRTNYINNSVTCVVEIDTGFKLSQITTTSRLNQDLIGNEDVENVRAIVTGQNPNGSFVNNKADGYVFSTSTLLSANTAYTSQIFSTSGYSQIQAEMFSDKSGTLVGTWYSDSAGTKLIRTFTKPYNSTDEYSYLSSPIFGPYLKYVYTNGSTNQTSFFLGLKFITKSISGQIVGVNDLITSNMVANLGRNIIMGQTTGGQFINVPVSTEGHLEVAIHDPLLPYGSIHVENLTPVFQTDAVYGINSSQSLVSTSLSGNATSNNNLFEANTGITQYSFCVIESRKRLRYRGGQGMVIRFTGLYSSPVANSYQLIGVGHAEDGVYFGYGNTADLTDTRFGILYIKNGVREVRTLTITTASSTTQNVTITLNNETFSVSVTNSANINRTVYEISRGTYNGWAAYPSGATVVFIRTSSGSANGTYSISGTTVVGSFTRTKIGVASTDTFIPQSSWNGDTLDGNGRSGFTIDPTKGNIYQIGIQYLGFGTITCQVETTNTEKNNSTMTTVHTIKNPNTLTTPIFSNPSFPFSMVSYSAGSISNISVKSASYAGFVEGRKILHGNRYTYTAVSTVVSAKPTLYALYTILNKRYYNGKVNQSVVNILSVQFSLAHKTSNAGGTLYLIRNAALIGNPSFSDYDTNSCTSTDTSATTCTYSTNSQIIWSSTLIESGFIDHLFSAEDTEITLQPGEYLTICGNTTTGTANVFSVTVNTREDQ